MSSVDHRVSQILNPAQPERPKHYRDHLKDARDAMQRAAESSRNIRDMGSAHKACNIVIQAIDEMTK